MSDLLHQPTTTAPTLYDVQQPDDLFASEEDVQSLKEAGLLSYELTARQQSQGGGGGDRSFTFHRIVKFGKNNRIEWRKPLSKELLEAGYEEEELNSGDPNQHIVGVRGIPINFNYGFRLSKDNGKETMCQTFKMVEHRPDGTLQVTESKNPLNIPIKSPYWSKKNQPDRVNWVLERNPHLDLRAKRRVETEVVDENGQPKIETTWVERSCAECVAKQEYTFGENNTCGVSGYLLFCVYWVGILDNTEHILEPTENPVKVRWVPIHEAGLKTFDGQPLDHPFIIRLEGLGPSQLNNVGMDESKFEIPVILPSHQAKKRKTCFLPDDDVMSAGQFYDWISNPNAVDGRSDISKNGKRLMTTITEIYMAQLHKTTATKDFIPVFRHVATGRSTTYGGYTIAQYMQTAITAMNAERSAAEGATSNGNTNTLKPQEPVSKTEVPAISNAVTEPVTEDSGGVSGNGGNGNGIKSAADKIKAKALSAYSIRKA